MNENRIQTILFKKKPWPRTKTEVEWAHGYLLEVYGETTPFNSPEGFAEKLNELELKNPNKSVINNMKAAWSRKKFRSKLKKNNKVEQNLILRKPNYDELNDLAYQRDTSLDSTLKYLLEHHRKSEEDIKAAKHQLEELQGKLELLTGYEKAIEELRCLSNERSKDMLTAIVKKRVTVSVDHTKKRRQIIPLEDEIKKDLQSILDKDLNIFKRLDELKNQIETKS